MRVATRGSPLARHQAGLVADRLTGAGANAPGHVDVQQVVVETTGDRVADAPIWQLGGQGVFVKEVQAAVLDGRADIAVHSAKDLPSSTAPGLVLAAVLERADPRDALVGATLVGLQVGGRVATGSVRRRAQLAWLRPDLTFVGLRGNIDTRLAQVSQFDALVMAAAALQRLGREDMITEYLDPVSMVPQVGQGALAVECREGDEVSLRALAAIEHPTSRLAVDAERAFLAEIGGGCDRPVGAFATVAPGGLLTLTGMVATADGRIVLRHQDSGDDGPALGRRVARYLLDDSGGAKLLEVG
ncbi:MAG: hydroxymethylbilane synthase [Acidimicrobiales bacterium]